jgi:hypothetical protein
MADSKRARSWKRRTLPRIDLTNAEPVLYSTFASPRPPFAYKASTSGSGGSAFWGLVDSPIQRQISLTITKTW